MSNIKINKRLILSAILSASLSTGFLAGYNPAEAAYRAPSLTIFRLKMTAIFPEIIMCRLL